MTTKSMDGELAPVATLKVTESEAGFAYDLWLSDGMWSVKEPGEHPLVMKAGECPRCRELSARLAIAENRLAFRPLVSAVGKEAFGVGND